MQSVFVRPSSAVDIFVRKNYATHSYLISTPAVAHQNLKNSHHPSISLTRLLITYLLAIGILLMDIEWTESLKALFPEHKRVIIQSIPELQKPFHNKM